MEKWRAMCHALPIINGGPLRIALAHRPLPADLPADGDRF
jgi:hypothetical protein